MAYVRLKKSALLLMIAVIAILLSGTAVLGITVFNSDEKMRTMQTEYDAQIRELEELIVEQTESYVTAYVLNRDVDAGSKIEEGFLEPVQVLRDTVPGNSVNVEDAVGKIVKIDMKKNSLLTSDMLYMEGEIPDDLRLLEYTVINLPSKLARKDYVDVRLNLPNGADYIVISKKRVEDLEPGRVWFTVNEKEILMMSSAIVDAYINDGILYATTYADPEMQAKAQENYPPNKHVLQLIKSNPNIVDVALSGLEEKMRQQLEDNLLATEHLIPKTSGRAPAVYQPKQSQQGSNTAGNSPSAPENPAPSTGAGPAQNPDDSYYNPPANEPASPATDDLEEQRSILGG